MTAKKIKPKSKKKVQKIDPIVQEIIETPMVERKKFNIWEFLGLK